MIEFDEFWAAYPKKKAKKDAERAFRVHVNEKNHLEVMDGLGKAKRSHDWMKEGGRFIPYPATWLRGHRWLDEISEVDHVEQQSGFWGTIGPGGPFLDEDGGPVRAALDSGDSQ